jgi:hypothetical protein
VGTRTPELRLRADGSLTLYVQADPPDALSNWLPVPRNEDFSLCLRAWWPTPAVLDGSWSPPPAVLR